MDDKIHVETRKEQEFFFLERLFKTQIPKNMLSPDLIGLLEKNDIKIDNVALSDNVKKEALFDFGQKENELVLKKIKK